MTNKKKPEEVCNAISQSLTGRTLSPEHAAKARIAAVGCIRSDETKRKIGEASKGRKHDDSTKAKMSESAKARGISQEQQAKMAESRIGLKRSQDSIEKSAKANLVPIQTGNVCYLGIKTAAEDLGMTSRMITTRLDSHNYPDWQRINKP